VRDFSPLADSLEWELGQHYLRDRGNKAFISDASPPFVINDDGPLPCDGAEVFAKPGRGGKCKPPGRRESRKT